MNKRIGIVLSAYGAVMIVVALAILGMGVRAGTPTVVVGLAGGFMSIIWGLLSWRGSLYRGLSILTLIPAALVLLSQSVNGWFGERGFSEQPLAVGLITLLFLCTVGTLMSLGYAGVAEPETNAGRSH